MNISHYQTQPPNYSDQKTKKSVIYFKVENEECVVWYENHKIVKSNSEIRGDPNNSIKYLSAVCD